MSAQAPTPADYRQAILAVTEDARSTGFAVAPAASMAFLHLRRERGFHDVSEKKCRRAFHALVRSGKIKKIWGEHGSRHSRYARTEEID